MLLHVGPLVNTRADSGATVGTPGVVLATSGDRTGGVYLSGDNTTLGVGNRIDGGKGACGEDGPTTST